MGLASRQKGARGELEVLEIIRARWPRATRNFASGAQGNLDIAHGPRNVVIDVKRTERLRLRDAWRQAEQAADEAGCIPVVATRWSATPKQSAVWLAILELEELLALLHLRETR
jgi:hypothetical protein